jgi:protein phosphatase
MTALITVAAAASETGLVRQNNEDAGYSGRWLYAVADGMGGHAAGEVASAAVIESLRGRDVEVPPAALLRTLGARWLMLTARSPGGRPKIRPGKAWGPP